MPDQSSKTEQPTEKRLKKAREEGEFPQAKDFIAALQFTFFLLLLGSGGQRWLMGFQSSMRALLRMAFTREVTAVDLTHIAWQLFWHHGMPLALAGMALALATLGLRLITTGFGFSFKKLSPDPARLNPISRLRELPRQNLSSLLQAALLLPVFLWAVYAIARDHIEAFLALPLASVESGSALVASSLLSLFWKAAGLFLVFGAVDLLRQLQRHRRELRMSKQDIKDEMKESEGNPLMKARIRRLQRDRARKQMMREVPTATAVIVNPTHYAVALRYQVESAGAPMVVAKGKDYLALRIRQKAIDHEVPIIENPPLAQALYKSAEVGQEIPPHLYRAVAEILAYIFKLMHGRLPG